MPVLTTGEVCRRLGVLPWQLHAAERRRFLDVPARVGQYRVYAEADLPRIREALVRAGYLRGEIAHA